MNPKLLSSSCFLCLVLGANSLLGADATPTPPVASATTTPAAAASAGSARGRGPSGPPATDADKAEMAKLMDLPDYATGLGDGDYSTGPKYAPAMEEKRRDDVPHGKIVNFVMDSSDSKIFPGNQA